MLWTEESEEGLETLARWENTCAEALGPGGASPRQQAAAQQSHTDINTPGKPAKAAAGPDRPVLRPPWTEDLCKLLA